MKLLFIILMSLGIIGCSSNVQNQAMKKEQQLDLEQLAFEGINIDFEFNSDKPTFGDLFLIVGFENPSFPPNSREFDQLNKYGIEQVDDYFGIRNNSDDGGDVKLWLFPVVDGEEVFHHQGPFDALRLSYVVVRNSASTLTYSKRFVQP